MLNRNNIGSAAEISAFRAALLGWYDGSARNLPWRSKPLPYRVWVSEIMLQQTRVDTVLPYFLRFMETLPDIPSLAAADEETLLKLWQGLGYYTRVRNLQKAAQHVIERFGGKLPSSVEELATLPGIGGYTAAAIASIAFGVPVPSVDGNLLRVLSRLTADSTELSLPAAKKKLTAVASALLPPDRSGDFNQAMMDIGATLCLPNGAPRCESCPIAGFCSAYQTNTIALYPVKAPKKARKIIPRTIFILRLGNQVLLRKRPDKGLLGGLWELPAAEGQLAPEQAEALLKSWGLQSESIAPVEDALHIFTHIEWRMRGYLVLLKPQTPPPDFIPADRAELQSRYTLPSAFDAYLKYLP